MRLKNKEKLNDVRGLLMRVECIDGSDFSFMIDSLVRVEAYIQMAERGNDECAMRHVTREWLQFMRGACVGLLSVDLDTFAEIANILLDILDDEKNKLIGGGHMYKGKYIAVITIEANVPENTPDVGSLQDILDGWAMIPQLLTDALGVDEDGYITAKVDELHSQLYLDRTEVV